MNIFTPPSFAAPNTPSATSSAKSFTFDAPKFKFKNMTLARSSRAIVRYFVHRYDDKSSKEALGVFRSRTRRVWGHVAICAWATSSWIAAASSLACSHPPPSPHVRVATPILASRTTTYFTPSPRTPDAVFTPVRGGRTGMSTSGAVLWFCLRVHLLALFSVTLLLDGPCGLRGREKPRSNSTPAGTKNGKHGGLKRAQRLI